MFQLREKPSSVRYATCLAIIVCVMSGAWEGRAQARPGPAAHPRLERLLAISLAAGQAPSPDEQRLNDLRAEIAAADDAGDPVRARRALDEAGRIFLRTHGERSAEYASLLGMMGQNSQSLGRFQEALELTRRSLAMLTELRGERDAYTLVTLNNLGDLLNKQHRYDEAEPMLRGGAERSVAALGATDLTTLALRKNLARALSALGRFAEAEVELRATVSALRSLGQEDGPEGLAARNDLALALWNLGRSREAAELLQPLMRRAPADPGRWGEFDLTVAGNLASALQNLGEFAEAERLQRLVLGRYDERGISGPRRLPTLNNLATNLLQQNRAGEAAALLGPTISDAERTMDPRDPNLPMLINNYASAFLGLGRPADAEPLLRRAYELARNMHVPDHPIVLTARASLAAAISLQGREAEAEPMLREILRSRIGLLGERHPASLASLNALAVNLTNQHRVVEAEALLRRSVALQEEIKGRLHPDTRTAYSNLSNLLLENDRGAEALPYARFAANADRSFVASLDDTPRASALGQLISSSFAWRFQSVANAAWKAGERDPAQLPVLRREVFEALQSASSGQAGRAMALAAARNAGAGVSGELGDLARRRQRLEDDWAAARRLETEALGSTDPNARDRRARLGVRLTDVERELGATDAALRARFPDYYSLVRPHALTESEARSLLASDEAALLVIPSAFGTHVMAVTREGLAWHRADLTAEEAREAVAALRRDLACAPRDCRGFDRRAAHGLYRALIAPVAPALAGKRHLFIVADGPFASLPFGVLVSAPPTGRDDDAAALRATSWFADAHALIQLPSLQSLALQRRSARPAGSNGGFAGFGDPQLGAMAAAATADEASRGLDLAALAGNPASAGTRPLAPMAAIRALRRLPGTAAELESLRAALGAPRDAVRIGAAATEATVRRADLSQARVIAFATHGALADDFGVGEPGLVLTPPAAATAEDDGLLVASEIAGLRLNADWVILSACNTGAGDGRGGAGLSGLARAFLYAGARTLLVSHWPVRDSVAPLLTVRTVTLQRDMPGLSRAQALQQAMREIRNDPRQPALAHPAAWAPFTLIGDATR